MSEIKSRFPQVTIPSRFPKLGKADTLPGPLQEVTSEKLNKEDVAFEHPAKGMKQDCDECVHWDAPYGCYLVNGIVFCGDWCNKWELNPVRKTAQEELHGSK